MKGCIYFDSIGDIMKYEITVLDICSSILAKLYVLNVLSDELHHCWNL